MRRLSQFISKGFFLILITVFSSSSLLAFQASSRAIGGEGDLLSFDEGLNLFDPPSCGGLYAPPPNGEKENYSGAMAQLERQLGLGQGNSGASGYLVSQQAGDPVSAPPLELPVRADGTCPIFHSETSDIAYTKFCDICKLTSVRREANQAEFSCDGEFYQTVSFSRNLWYVEDYFLSDGSGSERVCLARTTYDSTTHYNVDSLCDQTCACDGNGTGIDRMPVSPQEAFVLGTTVKTDYDYTDHITIGGNRDRDRDTPMELQDVCQEGSRDELVQTTYCRFEKVNTPWGDCGF